MGIRERENSKEGGGNYLREAVVLNILVKSGAYLRKAINRGTAIIRGNTVSYEPQLAGSRTVGQLQV